MALGLGRTLAGLLLAGGMFLAAPSVTSAQMAPALPLFEDDSTPERRAELYEQLNRDVAIIETFNRVVKTVVKLAQPTVVHIDAQKPDPISQASRRYTEEAGSGVIILVKGKHYVLTNRHVVKGAELERIHIRLHDGRELRPSRLWSDPDTDVAVLEVAGTRLVPARVGDSNNVAIGDFVLALGSPFGLSHSVTSGIISAKGRRDLELGESEVRFQDFMQTDAAINPGNSGGPLLNIRGEVIGINTAIASASGGNEGIGFTIPINMAMGIAEQLIEHGRVTRAFLGVNLDSRFNATVAAQLGLARPRGARISGVRPGSPASRSELQTGDVVLEFNGVRIDDDAHLINIVSLTEVGAMVPVVVWRDGAAKTIIVSVGDRSSFDQARR